jgi:hypothetical protein
MTTRAERSSVSDDVVKEKFQVTEGGFTSVSLKEAMTIVTPRAVVVGWLVGLLVSAMNISFGLSID